MQRLVTFHLDSHAYMEGKWVKGTHADKHGQVEEHLREELSDGWKVKSLFGFGGAADLNARGWITALLEKEDCDFG